MINRIRYYLRRLRRRLASWRAHDNHPLREFVYLDETSVYSLLASRLGAVAAEFTESESTSLKSDYSGEIQAGPSFAKGKVGGKNEASRTSSSQVLRRVTIQSAFRDLRDYEKGSLGLRRPTRSDKRPRTFTPSNLEQVTDTIHLIATRDLVRGTLVEVDVDLKSDSTYRFNALISAISETIRDNRTVFSGQNFAGFEEVVAMNRILDQFMVGLVPLRCPVADYVAVQQGSEYYLVHEKAKPFLREEQLDAARSVELVAVAESSLFWKDTRRLLFSDSRYTVLARMASPGLRETWRPVKLTEVLKEFSPELALRIEGLGELAVLSLATGATTERRGEARSELEVRGFTRAFLDHYSITEQVELVLEDLDNFSVPTAEVDVSARRRAFRDLARALDQRFDLQTSDETVFELRQASVLPAVDDSYDLGPSREVGPPPPLLIEVELVAVYW